MVEGGTQRWVKQRVSDQVGVVVLKGRHEDQRAAGEGGIRVRQDGRGRRQHAAQDHLPGRVVPRATDPQRHPGLLV